MTKSNFIAIVGTVIFLLATSSFHTNLTSQIISGFLITTLSIYLLYKVPKVSLDLSTILGFLFILSFNISYLFTQVPFGFKEFVTFNCGFLVYLSVKSLKFTTISTKVKSYFNKLVPVFFFLFSAIFLYYLVAYIGLPTDRFSAFIKGDELFTTYPNVLATFLLCLLPLNFYFYNTSILTETRFSKIIATLSLVILFTSLILTSSRGVFLATAFYLFFVLVGLLLLKKFAQAKKSLLIIPFIFACLFLALSINSAKTYNLDYSERISISADISSQNSIDERFVLFQNSLLIAKDNLFTGSGPGSFQFINPAYQTTMLVNSEHPHNIFLKLFAESGISTVIFFILWLLTEVFKNLKYNFRPHSLGLFLALLVSSQVDYNLGFSLIWILFFTYFGLISVKPSSSSKNLKLPVLVFASLLLGFICYQSLVFVSLEKNYSTLNNAPLSFKNDFLDLDPLTAVKFPNYPPSLSAYPAKYLIRDPYNNLTAYLNLFESNPDLLPLEFYQSILTDYTYLLNINSHHTVNTQNPLSAFQLYSLLTDKNPNNQELANEFSQFKSIYFAEMAKFDTRYKTNLVQEFLWKQSNS